MRIVKRKKKTATLIQKEMTATITNTSILFSPCAADRNFAWLYTNKKI